MLSSDGADDVYPPSEDTHLFIDALIADRERIERLGGASCLCVEIGIGSGAVSRALSENYGVHVIGGDVNSEALSFARTACPRTAIDLLRGDMGTWAARKGLFDIVLFNPPYVPTDEDELKRAYEERDIAASWAGGARGRVVIDRAICEVRDLLAPGGLFYLVVEKLNGLEDVRDLAVENGFSRGDVVRRMVAGRETLFVVVFVAQK